MASRDNTVTGGAYWFVPLCRALPAAALAILITFNQNHSPSLGLLAFGIFAVISGIVVALFSHRTLAAGVERSVFLAHGAISLLAGVIAFAMTGGGLAFFMFLVSGWAILTGFLELYAGIRSRGRSFASRDWIFIGALTVAFAVVLLVIPPDLRDEFTGSNGVSGVLSSSIIAVGLLGAYGAIVAVYLIIGGLSLKWAASPVTSAPQDGIAS
ncbi:MAG: hypothetical protein JWQ43_1589 [Glaciihabitans sp.]|nr:hypothetical protein [Glaciihabitans sp.]